MFQECRRLWAGTVRRSRGIAQRAAPNSRTEGRRARLDSRSVKKHRFAPAVRRAAPGALRCTTLVALAIGWALLAASALAAPAAAPAPAVPPGAGAVPASWAAHIEEVVRKAATPGPIGPAGTGPTVPPRIELSVGTLDPRLRLAPCEKVEVYLPAGHRAWGRTRAGVRCLSGPVRWNVFVPLTVRVLAPAVQAATALPAGTTLDASHLRLAEVDWAASEAAAFPDAQAVAGRTLQRALPAGATLRESDLQRRRWFAIGDIVRVVATGPGYAVTADGVALTPGIEGIPARVRTEGGRVVRGMPAADRRLLLQP